MDIGYGIYIQFLRLGMDDPVKRTLLLQPVEQHHCWPRLWPRTCPAVRAARRSRSLTTRKTTGTSSVAGGTTWQVRTHLAKICEILWTFI